MRHRDFAIKLDRPDRSYLAGEDVTGVVEVAPEEEATISLDVRLGWRITGGNGNRHDVPGEASRLCADAEVRPGDGPLRYPFRLALPEWPPSSRGKLFSVVHAVRAELRPRGRELVTADAKVVVHPSAATVAHLERAGARAATAWRLPWGLTCGGLLALIAVGAIVGAARSVGEAQGDLIGLAILAAACGAPVLFFALRNLVAERRLGRVYVGLPPAAPAGDKVPCLIRLQAARDVTVDAIRVTLRGEESATRTERARSNRAGRASTTTREELHSKAVVFARDLTLEAGHAFETERSLSLPAQAAPSFEAPYYEVRWSVEVRLELARWPDWVRTYPLQVTPVWSSERGATCTAAPRLGAGQVCPLCRDGVAEGQDLTQCAGCGTRFHRACMRELGGCSTRGCGRARG